MWYFDLDLSCLILVISSYGLQSTSKQTFVTVNHIILCIIISFFAVSQQRYATVTAIQRGQC